jgi:parvulin-like peptidyl-prolyl isomerase
VATVDGRPVWGSCVAAQAARGAPTQRAALDECIDFELLARAAEARGLAGAPEVREATRAALVSRLVETAFEDRYRAPADLAELVDRVVDQHRDQMDKPELRASAFARVEVPKGAPPEADAAARALAERIAGALAGEAGLFPVHLREAADRLAAGAGRRVIHGDFRAATREGLVPPYAEALYAIPEVGRIAAPARTERGWEVILLTRRMAPRVYTREEIAAEVFPEVRRRYFQLWVNQLARSLGVRVELDEEQIARLDEPRGQG